jgi:hypothetical protein
VNLATKTGTSHLRGTAYEFVSNDALNAIKRFAVVDTATGSAKPKLHYNQFGGTVGTEERWNELSNQFYSLRIFRDRMLR